MTAFPFVARAAEIHGSYAVCDSASTTPEHRLIIDLDHVTAWVYSPTPDSIVLHTLTGTFRVDSAPGASAADLIDVALWSKINASAAAKTAGALRGPG